MEMEQAREWAEAQRTRVSIDLVDAAKTHLKFLAAVDKNRFLYEDHALQRAIFRYNACWLPLLAKHLENPVCDGPLVVPLDCEWIWHCHRLNPVRYRFDCLKLFGRILSNNKVISSVQATKTTTEDIWDRMYPEEPFELDLIRPFSEDASQKSTMTEKFTSYDLVSAVKRQTPFIYQITKPHMSDDLFLQEAAARYKGFLHIIKANKKTGQESFSVPTYDIDLMWHTHQLHPDSYIKDMIELVGFVLQHDDTDSDRTKGGKLHNGFSESSNQWEQTFGFSYWKAGAMYKASVPTPVTQVPYEIHAKDEEFNASQKCVKQFAFPTMNYVEVLLEFLDIKNLPEEHKGNLLIAFSKKQADNFLKTKKSLNISSNSKEKQVAVFECEPIGEFLLELISYSPSIKPKPNSFELLGSCSLSLEELVTSRAQLYSAKWVSLDLVSTPEISKPILLNVSISFTPPIPAPIVYKLVQSQSFEDGVTQTLVMDPAGNKIMSLQDSSNIIVKDATKRNPELMNEVYCITDCGEKNALVEFCDNYWSVKGTHGSFKLQNNSGNDDSLFELVGHKLVKLFPGRRLDFQPMHSENKEPEQDFMTAIEFSTEYPYGKAVALIKLKSETIKATNDWIVLPCISLAFVLSEGRNQEQKNYKGEMAMKLNDSNNGMPVEENGAICGCPCIRTTKNNGTPCSAPCYATCIKMEENGAICGAPCIRTAKNGAPCLVPRYATCIKMEENGARCLGPCYAPCLKMEENGAICGAPCIRTAKNGAPWVISCLSQCEGAVAVNACVNDMPVVA